MLERQRTKTGVPGLDELVNGGIPKGSLVVVSGDPGSGKTSLCLEFIYSGLELFNENGVFISLEESVQELMITAHSYGWNLTKHINQKRLEMVSVELYDFEKLKALIEDSILKTQAQRLVIDPGVIFRLFFENELDARKKILSLGKMLKKMGCTTIITNEIVLGEATSLFGLEEYVSDGAILLFHSRKNSHFERNIGILKMRGTKISENLHPIIINQNGLHVLNVFDQGHENLSHVQNEEIKIPKKKYP